MVIKLADVGNLSKRLPQKRLVKVTSVVMKIGMRYVLFMGSSPRRILPGIFSTNGQPLSQRWDLLPHSICIDLTPKGQLGVKSSNLSMLLHDILPHSSYTPQARSLGGVHVEREGVPRSCDEAPIGLISTSNQELVPGTAKM